MVFSHTVTNTGNVLEGDGAGSNTALTLNHSLPGWTAVVYYDANNNGVIDPTRKRHHRSELRQ